MWKNAQNHTGRVADKTWPGINVALWTKVGPLFAWFLQKSYFKSTENEQSVESPGQVMSATAFTVFILPHFVM